jgi:hypothetical protein
MKRDRGRPEAGRPATIHVDGRPVDSDAVGEMTRALRRSAVYAEWDKLAVGQRVTLPTIEDIGAHLGDPRWDGWAARIEVKRLADAPKTRDRRWRTTVRVAMPGWFANLYAVYIEALPAFAAATHARQAKADKLATADDALRAGNMTIEDAAEALGRHSTTIARYRRLKKDARSIS